MSAFPQGHQLKDGTIYFYIKPEHYSVCTVLHCNVKMITPRHRLPREVVGSPSAERFKYRLSRHLSETGLREMILL